MPILTEAERVGTRLADKYDLAGIVGRGGMGTVFLATHAWTGRKVAVKLLKPAFAEDANVVRRFLKEARAAAAIQHPNVVDVLDMGQEPDGTVYMVLELLEGDSLGTLLRRRGRLSPGEALAVLLPVADALGAAHAMGFVHRDLKPDNVFVARNGDVGATPKLLDFGIAKILEDSVTGVSTRTGAIVGTPHYMSPEQASGSREVGPQTDVWALGVALFEALSGELPFTAETATGVLVKVLTTAAPPLRSVTPSLGEALAVAVDRALEPDLARRYADIAAMRAALDAAARDDGVTLVDPASLLETRSAPPARAMGRATGPMQTPGGSDAVVSVAVQPTEVGTAVPTTPRPSTPREAQPPRATPREVQPRIAPREPATPRVTPWSDGGVHASGPPVSSGATSGASSGVAWKVAVGAAVAATVTAIAVWAAMRGESAQPSAERPATQEEMVTAGSPPVAGSGTEIGAGAGAGSSTGMGSGSGSGADMGSGSGTGMGSGSDTGSGMGSGSGSGSGADMGSGSDMASATGSGSDGSGSATGVGTAGVAVPDGAATAGSSTTVERAVEARAHGRGARETRRAEARESAEPSTTTTSTTSTTSGEGPVRVRTEW